MTEQELRALVRSVIATHAEAAAPLPAQAGEDARMTWRQHTSHAMFQLTTGADEGGPCVIEPGVQCTHCGYCRSYGH
jgi:hypothetical protein